MLNPGFVPQGLDFAGTIDSSTLSAIDAQVEAFRDGAGADTGLMLDFNFAYSPQSVARLERRLARHDLRWLEYDHHLPAGLAELRRGITTPLASLEAVYLQRGYKTFLDQAAIDLAVVDLLWNGFGEGLNIARLCEANAINVAPHNFYGPIADLIASNFCAIVPNLKIMEFELDDVPWKYMLLTDGPVVEGGQMLIPTGMGWGADVDEAVLAEHGWIVAG